MAYVGKRCQASPVPLSFAPILLPARRYNILPIGPTDAVALAPRALFAHLPYAEANAVTHLTAARGFRAKVGTLRNIGHWNPGGLDMLTPHAASGKGVGKGAGKGAGKLAGKLAGKGPGKGVGRNWVKVAGKTTGRGHHPID